MCVCVCVCVCACVRARARVCVCVSTHLSVHAHEGHLHVFVCIQSHTQPYTRAHTHDVNLQIFSKRLVVAKRRVNCKLKGFIPIWRVIKALHFGFDLCLDVHTSYKSMLCTPAHRRACVEKLLPPCQANSIGKSHHIYRSYPFWEGAER